MQVQILEAVRHILDGRVIAYPTSTIWGLGCDWKNQEAISRIKEIKRRSSNKGLILVAYNWQEFSKYLPHLTSEQAHKISQDYEHPRTWLVEDKHNNFAHLRPDKDNPHSDNKIAIRLDMHPIVKLITQETKEPLISTSVNPSGEEAATSEALVREYFAEAIDYILPYDSEMKGNPRFASTDSASDIVDLSTGEFLRRAS